MAPTIESIDRSGSAKNITPTDSELWKSRAQLSPHRARKVNPQVDRISKQADIKLHSSLCGRYIGFIVCVVRLIVVAVKHNRDALPQELPPRRGLYILVVLALSPVRLLSGQVPAVCLSIRPGPRAQCRKLASTSISWSGQKGYRGVRRRLLRVRQMAGRADRVQRYGVRCAPDVIFNSNRILYNHTEKVSYARPGWTGSTI